MATLDRRVQVLFDPVQYTALEREASATNRSVGAIVREAVSERLRATTTSKQQALARMFERADALPDLGAIDWEAEKDSFERDM